MDVLLDEAWFSALGAPIGIAEEADIAAYLRGLELPATRPLRLVERWEEAEALMHGLAGLWWNREEEERRRLEQKVRLDPTDPQWIRLNDALHGAAAVAAARFGYSGAAMIKVAAGAASYAAYHFMLARGAGVPAEHPFLRKYALFAGGRWPLGVYDEQFTLF